MPMFFVLPEPPKVLFGHEIYDLLMGQIEPELVSANFPLLEAKMKGETEAAKKARGKRYNPAFIKYYEMLETYVAEMQAEIRRYKREARDAVESFVRSRNQKSIGTIEDPSSIL